MIEQQPEDTMPDWKVWETKRIIFEGMPNERHRNVINRKYSPQEIENNYAEILHDVPNTEHKSLTTNQYVSMKTTINMV